MFFTYANNNYIKIEYNFFFYLQHDYYILTNGMEKLYWA